MFERFRAFLKRLINPLFFITGLALLVWTIRIVGAQELVRTFALLRGPGVIVLFFYPFVSFWDAWGWLYSLGRADRSKAGVLDLFLVRLAGEAMNNLTPLADWGGEPLKIRLLEKRFKIAPARATASVLLAKSMLFYSEALFWAVGLIPAVFLPGLPADWKRVFLAVFAGCVIFAFALAMFQMKGFFGIFGRFLGRHAREVGDGPLRDIDSAMAAFYADPLRRFAPSFGLHLAGWFMGGLETFLMLSCLGSGVSLGESLALEALLQLTRTATFFIPGSLGVQEAGMAVFFAAFGFPAHEGVAMSLLKRARQLLWNAVGLGVWACYEWRITRKA